MGKSTRTSSCSGSRNNRMMLPSSIALVFNKCSSYCLHRLIKEEKSLVKNNCKVEAMNTNFHNKEISEWKITMVSSKKEVNELLNFEIWY